MQVGSVGDIIALGQVALQLARAIGVAGRAIDGESAEEYRALRHELEQFGFVLLQVVAALEQSDDPTALTHLDKAAKDIIDECAGLIANAHNEFQQRYHASLQPGGSGNRARDVFKKISWATREREHVKELRETLHRNIDKLILLNTTSIRRSLNVHRTISENVKDQKEALQTLCDQQRATEQQTAGLREAHAQLAAQMQKLVPVAERSLSVVVEVKELLALFLGLLLQALFSSTISLRTLDPTRELPVTIEDALGWHLTVPAEWLDFLQWDTLQNMLQDRFRGCEGHHLVQKKSYVLEESCTGREIDSSKPLASSFRRGMKVNMTMILKVPRFNQRKKIADDVCPRCGGAGERRTGNERQCTADGCGMYFQLQIEDSGQIMGLWGISRILQRWPIKELAHLMRVRLHIVLYWEQAWDYLPAGGGWMISTYVVRPDLVYGEWLTAEH